MINWLKKDETGYSMVEVLAAIVILSLAILPMVGMFDAGLRAAVLGGNYDKARTLANANLEEAKALGYAKAEALEDCPYSVADLGLDGFTCELDTERARIENGEIKTGGTTGTMLEVTVTVSWNGGDYETSGIVASGGPG